MLNWDEILIRLSLACLFGGLIGLERERKDWAAGLRTHMMVCVGSSLIMIVSAFGFSDILGTEHVELDPSRVAAQVISGIGFIGAGTILFLKQGTIRGLTTAAGLWTVAAIGLATGGGMYFAAGVTTAIALTILWALQPLELMYTKKFKQKTLTIVTSLNINNTDLFKNLSNGDESKIQNFTFERNENEFTFQLKLENMEVAKINNLIDELKKDPAIKEISWSH
ncbi:MgtC/SapB family protein [Flavobacterium sp. NG2]|uniref:MgtC/SapB family protein n=1 Tax=Flavobacterium sp. NG2 TaxID=3097547 RepID=UPI002A7F9FCF|nr:MgtC/SapB family protein [Flavobacterium sp. NG2]WPR70987.1 MgtC/SapB family protein [Flavobacterium sp. NG2]